MADKELTVFLLDATVPSSAYKYVFDTLAAKLLKGLKTDYVSVATFHSATTNHASEATGKFKGIDLMLDFETVSFEGLQRLQQNLTSAEKLSEKVPPECADIVQTLLFASTLFEKTKRKKFTRNLVIISSANASVTSSAADKLMYIPKFYAAVPVNLHIIVTGDKSVQLAHDSLWGKVRKVLPDGQLFTAAEASRLLEQHPAVRKTFPVAAHKGELRLGSNFERVIYNDAYRASQDQLCISFEIELYPAAKFETSYSDSHEYILNAERNIKKVERRTTNFVWERDSQTNPEHTEKGPLAPFDSEGGDPEKGFDKVEVDASSLTEAYKFSNFDLIALDADLLQATKLPLFHAFDVFGFIPVSQIPNEYLTDEALYVVPTDASTLGNSLNFQAFVDALQVKKLAALCRLVRKQTKEVEVGAAFPVEIKCSLGVTRCLVFVRLPFKEDEKVGRFPSLKSSSGPETAHLSETDMNKSARIGSLMDDFVNAKSYESDDEAGDESHVIDNFKVTMHSSENSKLALPPKPRRQSPFLCSSPATTRYQTHVRRLLLGSLTATNWSDYFEDPQLIKKHLKGEGSSTNFFNLENCMSVNRDQNRKIFLELSEKSRDQSKRLAQELGVEYVRKAESKKTKKNKNENQLNQKGNYGADEGQYGELPDINLF